MELIILGKNTKSKGAELEKFCRRFFIKLGFRNSTLNFIAAGGNEYDVTAEKIVTREDGTEETIPIIAECKAYNKPCEMTHWLKFLGKFHTTYSKNKLAEGYFVALSDVNGNVWGAATPLIDTNHNLHIIAKDALIEYIQKEYNLCSVDTIRGIGELYSNKVVDTVDLILFDNQIYWLLRFNSKDFTIVKSDNTPITSKELKSTFPHLTKKIFFNFVDLISEKEKILRISEIKGFILYCALNNCGNTESEIKDIIQDRNYPFTYNEVVSILKDTEFVSDTLPIKLIQPQKYLEFFRYFMLYPVYPSIIKSPEHQNLINECLLNEILSIQGNLQLDSQKRNDALFILRVSPSAICNVIFEDSFLVNASRNSRLFNQKYHSKIQEQRESKFFKLLIEGFGSDIHHQELWKFANELGVSNYSIHNGLIVNKGLPNEIKIEHSPLVYFAPVENIPSHPIIPFVRFDEF